MMGVCVGLFSFFVLDTFTGIPRALFDARLELNDSEILSGCEVVWKVKVGGVE